MKKLFLTAIVAMAVCLSVGAQSRSGLYINEVMLDNDSSMVDDFGQHSAWVELFNSTHAPMEIKSIYITSDRTTAPLENLKHHTAADSAKVYAVPLGDVNTKIPKRQHIIFWLDGQPTRGTFHTNLVFDPAQTNYIAIYDSDGQTLIDEVEIPVMATGHSWARSIDGAGVWAERNGDGKSYITPSSNNIIRDSNDKVETFKEKDPHGFIMTAIAMGIVFCALLVLCLCFMLISKIGEKVNRTNKMNAQGIAPATVPRAEHPQHDSGEEIAAIAMALYEHLNAHDTENTILTINKIKKSYSPWSSKIYNMRQYPHR